MKMKKNTRKKILDMAIFLFEESDYDSVQMNSLAKILGLSNGAIFYHFPTKQTLFYEIYNIYYQRSVKQNLAELSCYETMTREDLKVYLLHITSLMFENNFNMLRLLKIHTMVLDKGVNVERIKESLVKSMYAQEHFLEELQRHCTYFCTEYLRQIFTARSALCIGYYYMYMEPKTIDLNWRKENIDRQKIIFQRKLLATFEKYLDGMIEE